MTFTVAGQILGGIGIFFLALSLLTQGLQAASQSVMQQLLARFGRTPLRGLVFGGIATVALQSSTVTIALIISLVNAAALSFSNAAWMILGSNIGTTATGWMVSLTGIDINLKAYALPLVGAGMMMQSIIKKPAWKSLGMILTGFGLFFIGIDTLKDAFSIFGEDMKSSLRAADGGILALAGFVLSGLVLTLVTQSSTATTVLILTAAAAGMTDFTTGAALLIGANIGTTSTAVLVSLSGSGDAKRAAALHVIFNFLTGCTLFFLLPWVLPAITTALAWAGADGNLTVVGLAAFHTFFSIFGVVLFWPFMSALTRFLETRLFQSPPKAIIQTGFALDKAAYTVPAVAFGGLSQEMARLKNLVCTHASALFNGSKTPQPEEHAELSRQIGDYAIGLSQESLPEDVAHSLQHMLRVHRYLAEILRLSEPAARIYSKIHTLPETHETRALLQYYLSDCHNLVEKVAQAAPLNKSDMLRFSRRYNTVKDELLEDAVRHKLPIAEASALLDDLSLTRRLVEQAAKAQRWYDVAARRYTAPAQTAEPVQAAA